MGVISAEEANLRHFRRQGRRSVEELVDAYELSCRPVRDLLVRYLKERGAGLDYSSLRALLGILVGTFWKDLEIHHLGIDSLRLEPALAQAWKERAAIRRRDDVDKGRARTDPYQILFVVRAFYLDLSQWALDDASWAEWVVPNRIRDHDVKGSMKHQRRRTAAMHQRTRTLAPILPQLVRSAEERLRYLERLVAAAEAIAIGEELELDGVEWTQSALLRSGSCATGWCVFAGVLARLAVRIGRVFRQGGRRLIRASAAVRCRTRRPLRATGPGRGRRPPAGAVH
jgi:hypothetical protein